MGYRDRTRFLPFRRRIDRQERRLRMEPTAAAGENGAAVLAGWMLAG